MMQIGSTLPAHNLHQFQVRRASFNCSGSPLNPLLTKPRRVQAALTVKPLESTEITRKHLSNLERLLQKESSDPQPAVTTTTSSTNVKESNLEDKGRGLLEGLNLSRIWPEMKAAEEMSPRHMNRLQRLLSKSYQEYSPRNNLGRRWREYHGCDDWSGLLDPLDENLRRELVRYGEFVQAAYRCFHSNPAMSADQAPSPQHVNLPDRSYKVTKSLYATSSIGLPKWVDDMAPDLSWMTQRSSWIGYVAVCDDRKEIQRMGRRDIVIALRGTATCLEWAENMRDLLVELPDHHEEDEEGGEEEVSGTTTAKAKVECGFSSLYKTPGAHVPSLAESVVNEVQRLIEQYKGETLSITVTGHSLGAALALLVGDELSNCAPDAPPVAVFSFGGPRVGNRAFANRVEEKNVKVLRVVNSQDVITRVPGMLVSESLEKKLRESGGAAAEGLLKVVDEKMPWAYSHVGTELKVDTRMSPYLKPNADVACCHDLEAYLHLVDGFMASNCPFRANAKRSLVKLLNEQGSNVKRLYISKANSLSLNLERTGTAAGNVQQQMMSSCLPSPSS